jgi:tRNA nucleotidyltransferase (CCA-adding enzyme)
MRLVGCLQDAEWHPEGDVWEHTKLCLDNFAGNRIGDGAEDLVVGLAVLCHDMGKPYTSFFDPARGHLRSPGHDEAGAAPARAFLGRLTNEERLVKAAVTLVRLHMRPFSLWKGGASDNAVRRLAAEVGRIDRLIRVASSDVTLGSVLSGGDGHLRWLAARAEALKVADSAPRPIVQGRDLVALGLEPSAKFGEILKRTYEAQLDGRFFDLAGGVDFVKGIIGR